MAYEDVARFMGSAGLIYMMVLFAVVLAYALWPRNRARFERAARIPLEDDAPPPAPEERR